MGRLSASELCSLPMVPAAMAAEEQRTGGHRSRGGATTQGAEDTDATLSLGAAAGPGVELARPAHARARAPGNREALFG